MNWRNWKNHPFIFTLVGALLLGYLVRKLTEPSPYRHTYEASRPVATTPASQSVPTPAPTSVPVAVTPAPVVTTPAPVASKPSQYQVAQLPTRPATSAPVTFSAPVERPVIPTPSYGSGRRGYTTYTFTIEEISYVLDGQAAFDHLGQMKQRAHVFDPEITRLRAECAVLQSQIDESKSQLNQLRAVLDRTDQSAIDGFNAKVRASNAIIGERRAKVAELNAIVDQFNAIVSAMHVYAQQHRR
jgi:hypothetical protein